MKATQKLASFAAGLEPVDLPDSVREQARRAFLDTLAVTLAGMPEDCSRLVADYARSLESRPEATIVGSNLRTAAPEAALVNGTAAHALDFDDVSEAMMGHPSAPLVPAVLALGERLKASGEDILLAYVAGFEVQARLGRLLGPGHYTHGWHATSTLGTLGAAAACARLLRLDEPRTVMALGIGVSLASGSRQNFGTMTKPLHAGLAARNGLVAALLAADGFTADASAIEAPLGFAHLYTRDDSFDIERGLQGLEEEWTILKPGISVKKYPCCFATHCALDAVLDLRRAHAVEAQAVQAIDVVVPEGALSPLIHTRPSTGLEGKFSMQYCVATALVDGVVRLSSFTDEAVQRAQVQALTERVRVREEPRRQGTLFTFYADVTIELPSVLRRTFVDTPRGHAGNPLSWEELVDKFRDCAFALPQEQVERALEAIQGLDGLRRVTELTETLAVGAPAGSR